MYIFTLILSVLSILSVGLLWILNDYSIYKTDISKFKSNYLKQEKEILSNEAERAVSLIKYNNSLTYNRLNKLVKQRVNEAYKIAISIYNKYKDSKSKDEIIEIIKNTLREARFFNNRGYYFMYDLDGKLIMHGIKPEFEGTYKFKDFTDLNGKKVLYEFIDIINKNKEGYLQWTFYRPDKLDVQASKVGYAKLIEPLNYFIGTADYIFKIEEDLKYETLNRIKNISYGNDEYILISNTDGKILSHRFKPNLEKKNISLLPKEYQDILNEIYESSKLKENGFVKYLSSNNKINKIVYFHYYKKWNWYIITQKDLSDLESIVESKEEELSKKIMNHIIYICLIMIFIIIVVLVLSRIFIKRIEKTLSVFISFFKKVNIDDKKLPIKKLPFLEFQELGNCINEMLDIKLEQQKDINEKNQEVLVNSSLLNEYKKAVDASTIVSKTNKEGIITYVNEEFCKISGYNKTELIGNKHNIVRHPNVKNSVYKNMWKKILNKKVWKGVLENRTKDGSSYFVKVTIVPILDVEANIKEFIAIRYDVTKLIKQANKIRVQITDPLTKLPNRQKLLEDLENEELKLVIFNIVRFKEINEYYGYDIGDEVIKEISNELKRFINSSSLTLYKLQGDEFAILAKKEVSFDEFKKLANKLISHIRSNSIKVNDNNLDINIIAGMSFQKNYLINAEMAKNFAKETKNELVIFDENLNIKDNIVENITRTKQLKDALAQDRIVVFIQPIISNNDYNVNKYECLVRMIDEQGKIISPMVFLNIAKKSNMYTQTTSVVINKAFEYFSTKDVEFSINLTIEDILSNEINTLIYEKIQEFPQVANRVILEIVEDEGIENYDEVSSFIEKMKSYGCRIAIDDFGTGYSNFDYLMKLNVDFIKIDGSMIRYLDYDDNAKLVTQLIVEFAKKLNIKTIAEFVHSEEIRNIVKDMEIDYSQGFYLGEPKQI